MSQDVNVRFRQLLNKGIQFVRAVTGNPIKRIELDIAEQVNYARPTVRIWRQGRHLPKPDVICDVAAYCCRHGGLKDDWARALLISAGTYPAEASRMLAEYPIEAATEQKRRIFFCYSTQNPRDLRLVISLAHALADYECFFYQGAFSEAGAKQQIEDKLAQADVILLLLSAEAIRNEFVLWQLTYISSLWENQPSQGAFLTIRVGFRDELSEQLVALLPYSEWTYWRSERDDQRLFQEITSWLCYEELPFDSEAYASFLQERTTSIPEESRMPIPPPYALRLPRGPLEADSRTYIRRSSDDDLHALLSFPPCTVTIRGNRQSGKTSLLVQSLSTVPEPGFQVAFIDFQLFELYWDDPDQFYFQLCYRIASDLGLPFDPADHFLEQYGVIDSCTQFMEDYVLNVVDGPVLLAMDEVENMLDKSMGQAFMKMVRAWHGRRALSSEWKKLSMVLITSTEPYALIKDLNNSPFNVSEKINLQDFTLAEITLLNECYENPVPATDLPVLYDWLHGHPFLTQVAFYTLASGKRTANGLFSAVDMETEVFGEHLRTLRSRFLRDTSLVEGLKQAVFDHKRPSEDMIYRLESAGLIRRENQQLHPRCKLYQAYFRELFSDQ